MRVARADAKELTTEAAVGLYCAGVVGVRVPRGLFCGACGGEWGETFSGRASRRFHFS